MRLLLLFLSPALVLANFPQKSLPNVVGHRYEHWAATALEFLTNVSCESSLFSVKDHCEKMKRRSAYEMNIYSAEAPAQSKLIAVSPDGELSRSGEHDGILAIDPFPEASFGHLVLVFFADRMDMTDCYLNDGIYIDKLTDCLQLAKKNKCHKNVLRKRRRHSHKLMRKCEVDFLPSVFETSNLIERDGTWSGRQLLECRDAVPFRRCPSVRSGAANVSPACASAACQRGLEKELRVRCRLFEVCDHAVVVQGAWNRLVSRSRDEDLVMRTRQMLLRHNFPRDNAQTFFANGLFLPPKDADANVHPASNKRLLREHIRNICSKRYCVDSFVLFFRGPTLSNGALLLWDKDENGLADSEEMYTVEEMMEDLAHCGANRVHLVLDEAHGGWLVRRVRANRARFRPLVLVSSLQVDRLHPRADLLKVILSANHSKICFNKLFSVAKASVKGLETVNVFGGADTDEGSSTLFGAPCNVTPAYSESEIHSRFFGCQNIPTLLWFKEPRSKYLRSGERRV